MIAVRVLRPDGNVIYDAHLSPYQLGNLFEVSEAGDLWIAGGRDVILQPWRIEVIPLAVPTATQG